jgi:hypothetical protein
MVVGNCEQNVRQEEMSDARNIGGEEMFDAMNIGGEEMPDAGNIEKEEMHVATMDNILEGPDRWFA